MKTKDQSSQFPSYWKSMTDIWVENKVRAQRASAFFLYLIILLPLFLMIPPSHTTKAKYLAYGLFCSWNSGSIFPNGWVTYRVILFVINNKQALFLLRCLVCSVWFFFCLVGFFVWGERGVCCVWFVCGGFCCLFLNLERRFTSLLFSLRAFQHTVNIFLKYLLISFNSLFNLSIFD